MWVDALVILKTSANSILDRGGLDAAMHRRGWEKSGTESYVTSFINPQSDESIVNQIEQDVHQAVYVAGLSDFDAVCLLSDALTDDDYGRSSESRDSDFNLDLL